MHTEAIEQLEFDIVVVGAGGAGLRAAIAAADAGKRVAVLSKSLLGKAHTVMAEGGIAASFGNVDPEDSWETHFYDTMQGGKFLNNYRTVEIYTKEVPDRVLELESWGALFDRTEAGRIMQRPFGAHTFRRLCHVGDRTGLELIRTLQYRAIQTSAEIFPEFTTTALLKDGERVVGVLGYHRSSGRIALFRARAVVLASGGWGRAYKVTSNSWESTGEGAAMAYWAGAELADMEMVQFHPTGMVWPPGVRGILVTEGVRGEGGILLNSEGERFMLRYDPQKKDLSSRDVVARSIYKEVQAGRGTPHGGAWLDITHRGPEYIKRKLPNMYDQFLTLADVDITKEKFEVAPTVHYTMGGVRADPETCATNVPGLFAAGEVACGLHGANRLGGNSLGDLLVFGKRAGEGAVQYVDGLEGSLKVEEAAVDEAVARLLEPLGRSEGENPFTLQAELQEVMSTHAGIARDGKGLEEGLAKVKELQERAKRLSAPGGRMYNPGWHTVNDVRSMLILAEAIFRGAIARKESRGAHWRTDYPDLDEALQKVNFIEVLEDGEMRLKTSPVPEMPTELKALFSLGTAPGLAKKAAAEEGK
jgi:succinate dehydrogenase / fumarate reductase flavoprotein subunit